MPLYTEPYMVITSKKQPVKLSFKRRAPSLVPVFEGQFCSANLIACRSCARAKLSFYYVLNMLIGNLRTTTKFTTTTSVDWERPGTRTSVSAGKRNL